jgi:hypothetical protein
MDAYTWVIMIGTVLMAAAAVTVCVCRDGCCRDLLLERGRDELEVVIVGAEVGVADVQPLRI